jgi:phage gpG-like protein
MKLNLELSPEARELLATLPAAPVRAAQGMARELDLQNELTIGYAQREKLSGSGPTTLGVRTGLLRRSLRRTDSIVHGALIDGAIGSNVAYAGVHEFGFDGDVTVRSFTRRNRRRDLFSVKKKKLSAVGVSYVKSFTRHMHMPERSYIRSSINERLPRYNAALSKAIIEALTGRMRGSK